MAASEVDSKFLGQFALNIHLDHPMLSKSLYQLLGNLLMLSDKVIKARKLRRLDTSRDTPSLELYCNIIWYAREGLKLLEDFILPAIEKFGELKVVAYKIRASFYHLYVLYHNYPNVNLKMEDTLKRSNASVTTPPGLNSPEQTKSKGKGVEREFPKPEDKGTIVVRASPKADYRPTSVQATHPLEGGPVTLPPEKFGPNFLIPTTDYRMKALLCFEEAAALSELLLWGSHPLRLSAKVEFSAFLYDCLHDKIASRQVAKQAIHDVYNAQEGMDDDMFNDAAELVGLLGRMARRGEHKEPISESFVTTHKHAELISNPIASNIPVTTGMGLHNPI